MKLHKKEILDGYGQEEGLTPATIATQEAEIRRILI
jgi:hypothetical protein